MGATIAIAVGGDRGRSKRVSRLGSESATVEAATWRTFARAYVNRDGSGYVEVKQNGKDIYRFEFGPEA